MLSTGVGFGGHELGPVFPGCEILNHSIANERSHWDGMSDAIPPSVGLSPDLGAIGRTHDVIPYLRSWGVISAFRSLLEGRFGSTSL